MKIYFRLLKFLRPHLLIFSFSIIFMFISSLLGGVSLGMIIPLFDKLLYNREIIIGRTVPPYLQNIIDWINTLHPMQILNFLIPVIISLFLFKYATTFLSSYLTFGTSQRVVQDIRNSLYEKLLCFSLDYYDRAKTGTIVSRVTYDVSIIQDFICRGTMDFIYQSLQLLVFISIAFFISPEYSMFIIILIPFIIIPVLKVGKKLRKIGFIVQEKMADVNSVLFETVSGIRLVQAFSMEKIEADRFKKYNYGFYKNIMRAFKRTQIIGPATEFIAVVGTALFLWFGVRAVINQNISAGVFILFIGSILSMMKPAKRLTEIYGIAQVSVAAANRIFEVFDQVPTVKEKNVTIDLKNISKSIKFENVQFAYADGELILNGINIDVAVGETVAIVGQSGVGKTTFVHLIPRFYDITGGSIKIDDTDIRDFKISDLRSKIAVVTQETILFNDTVSVNIAFGKSARIGRGVAGGQGASMDEIIDAAKKANAHSFILSLPKGYDTFVGDRGYTLSGGERQRIAIARAILKNAPILILDEATSQLDSYLEKLVQNAIQNLMQGKTVFIIAHRLSTVQNADKIVILENGNISAVGRHDQLMESSDLYKRLYELQFK